jgi:hypothetical protein
MSDGRRATAFALVAAVALGGIAGGCGGDGSGDEGAASPVTFVAVDGSPRTSDDAGVLTSIADDFSSLVLDGDTVYAVSPAVQSFASVDGSTQPLNGRVGQYVQVGLDDETVVWVAGLGAIVRLEGQPETVVYLGRITAVRGSTVELQDGTVLRLADGLTVPGDPSRDTPLAAVLTIDVASDTVVEVVPG